MIEHRNLQRAIWPLTVVSGVFGFAIWEYPLGTPRPVLTFLYIITFWCFYGYCSVIYLSEKLINDVFPITVGWMLTMFHIIINIAFSCLHYWHRKRYEDCLESFNKVDDTLEKFGIVKEYKEFRQRIIKYLIVWTCWSLFLNVLDTLSLPKSLTITARIFTPLIMDINIHLCHIIDIQFWCLMRYAGSRFDCIEKILNDVIGDKDRNEKLHSNERMFSVQVYSAPEDVNKQTIWTMMHVHFQLCEILRNINIIYGAQIVLETASSFMYIISSAVFSLRLILIEETDKKWLTGTVIWIWALSFILKLLLSNHICEIVTGKTTMIGRISGDLVNRIRDEKLRKDICFLMLQQTLKPVEISGLGFFNFGYPLLYRVSSFIVTVVVIILQMNTAFQID